MARARFIPLSLACLVLALSGVDHLGAAGLFASVAIAPGDLIIDDEAPQCPVGGPIYRIHDGQISVLAQGTPVWGKPRGNVIDGDGNLIVADGLANTGGIKKLNVSTAAVSTIAVSPPVQPRDVAIDRDGNYIAVGYAEDNPSGAQSAVYRITSSGQVTVVASDAPLKGPHGLDIDSGGNYIVADNRAGVIRVTAGGEKTLVKASGTGTGLIGASDVRVDDNGDYIVTDIAAGLVKVKPDGTLSVIHRGTPFSSINTQAQAIGPRGVVIDNNGDYLVLDQAAKAVFRVTPQGTVTTVFSGGPLCGPADLNIYRPPSPFLDSPAPGTALTGLGANLNWKNPPGTTQFQIQVIPANNDGPGINIIRNADIRFVVEPPVIGKGPYVMLPGMSYTWRVRTSNATAGLSENDTGWSAWAPARTFRTPAPTSAGITPVSPAPGAIARSPVSVQWSNSATEIFYYELQVSPDPDFGEKGPVASVFTNLVHGGIGSPQNSWMVPPVQANRLFWRGRPRVQGDGKPVDWSPTWDLRTGP